MAISVKPTTPVLQSGNSLATSLILALPFYENTGTTANDLSTQATNFTIGSGNTWGSDGAEGVFSKFSNTINDKATGTMGAVMTTAGSMSYWFYTGTTVLSNFFHKFNSAGNGDAIKIIFNAAATITVTCWQNNTTSASVTSSGTYNDNTWHLIVWTFDGTTLKVWVDNVSIGTATGISSIQDSNAFLTYIGYDSTNAAVENLGDVRVWNKTLSAAEVAALWNSPWALYSAGNAPGSLMLLGVSAK